MSENNTATDRSPSWTVIASHPFLNRKRNFMHRVFVAFFGIWTLLSSPALAETIANTQGNFETIDAEKLIEHCWEISFELRSGSTASTRFGFIETLTCLRQTIVEQTMPIIRPGSWTPAYAEWLLTEMAAPYAEFFDSLYNAHKHCFCGTQYSNIDLAAVCHLYETVLRDVVDVRNRFEL